LNEKKIEAAKRQYVHNRNWRRARDRALVKLAKMHLEEYQELLKRERAHDEQTGKKWLDIDGTTTASNVGTQPITTPEHDNEASNKRAYKSNYGGEA
jgi:hypothetical protein